MQLYRCDAAGGPLARADELDAHDALEHIRQRYLLPNGIVYLDGNSLGPLPAGVPTALDNVVRHQWGQGLVRSWIEWMNVPLGLGDRIGQLIGAAEGTTVVGDSTSVQIFNTLTAAARLRPERPLLLTDLDHFPTDRYLADSVARLLGLTVQQVRVPDVPTFLSCYGDRVGVVALPAVDYRTGERWDLPGLTTAAHQAGALTVWDVCHAVGAMPLELDRDEVDFAVGCTYKYLSGGPGAPAFVYVNPRHHDRYDQPLTGWLGHAVPFATSGGYVPAQGIGRAVIGTPPMLSALALEAALDAYDGVRLADVRAKSLSLTGYFIECVDELLAGYGFEVVTPRQNERRASQVSLRHADAYPLVQALIQRRVLCDMREPDLLRFGFNALYISHRDVHTAVEQLRAVIETGEQQNPAFTRHGPFG